MKLRFVTLCINGLRPTAIGHHKIAVFFLITTVLSLVLASVLVPAWHIAGAAYALLIGDCAMAAYVLHTSMRQLNEERWVSDPGTAKMLVRAALNVLPQ